ncbi:MAG: hypothetical protein ABW123_21455 [Cystobacter sp.]
MRVHPLGCWLVPVLLVLAPGCKKEPESAGDGAVGTDELLGADTDGNGVRDDLDAAIEAKPDTAVQKKALRQFAAALSGTLLAATRDGAAVREAASRLDAGLNCVFMHYDGTTAATRSTELEKASMNTRQRINAYAKYNSARSGSVTPLPEGDTCDR